MKHLSALLLVAAVILGALVPLRPSSVSAQPEETPILGEPTVMTPLVSSVATSEADVLLTPTTATSAGTFTPSAVTARSEPDTCEPNDAPAQACALPLDAVSGPFTIVPDSDQDFFLLDLPQEASIQTLVTARATAGLDLVLAAHQGNALIASGTFSLTLDPNIVGPVVLRVENRDPRPATGEQYRIEVRREIVPPRRDSEAAENAPAVDALENNWSFATAAPIAVGVVYDLSFVCPEQHPDACPGGDHDYLQVPVKAGVRYLLTTFDLDPGVDTVVELFWNEASMAVVGNDDYSSGGMLSALRWTAPSDGLLYVRIAPRNGGLVPQLTAEAPFGYRFAVAPEGSELARKLEATIRQQANVPSATPTAAPVAAVPPAPSASGGGGGVTGGSTSSAAPAGTGSQGSIAAGLAIIVQETVLRREPNERSTALATLAPETVVSVRGPVSGLWVSIESEASILPGWVRWSDLQRLDGADSPTQTPTVSVTTDPAVQQPGTAELPNGGPTLTQTAASAASSGNQVAVTKLDPALPAPPAAPVARVPFALSVTVVATDLPPTSSTLGFATPTPDMRQPVAGIRVQLVNIFGDVLAEGRTDVGGSALLRRDIRPGDALAVRIPAWGVELPLAAEQSSLILTIPEGEQ